MWKFEKYTLVQIISWRLYFNFDWLGIIFLYCLGVRTIYTQQVNKLVAWQMTMYWTSSDSLSSLLWQYSQVACVRTSNCVCCVVNSNSFILNCDDVGPSNVTYEIRTKRSFHSRWMLMPNAKRNASNSEPLFSEQFHTLYIDENLNWRATTNLVGIKKKVHTSITFIPTRSLRQR